MSRSGYTEDCYGQWSWICYRGAVASAIRGKRGQAFLRELLTALDEMPEKRLIAEELTIEGDACALGVIARRRGIDVTAIDAYDYDSIHTPFGISNALAREIIWENDERGYTPEERWRNVRAWIERQLIERAPSP
jgi:hypothetical protein